MKQRIDAFEYASDICKAMKKGILLTTKVGDFVNTMTIGWGNIGIEWNKPVLWLSALVSRPQNIVLTCNSD